MWPIQRPTSAKSGAGTPSRFSSHSQASIAAVAPMPMSRTRIASPMSSAIEFSEA
jgi:hypothetical protein